VEYDKRTCRRMALRCCQDEFFLGMMIDLHLHVQTYNDHWDSTQLSQR